MMDDILNHLSSIQGLEVKSRQSSERYRESDKSIPQIGVELGANYLLEGSVQKQKNSIRIIVQLIDAKNDKHLWSDKFTFELINVFTIQSEISRQIANELNAVISPFETEQINKKPTENLEAYNLYLKGRFFWHNRTEEDINKSINYFNQAIELDSTYTLAYTGLADSYFVMPFYTYVKDLDSVFKLSKEYAKKALSLDNNNAEAHATLGGLLCFKDWNWEASEKEFKLAINLNPNYATAHQYYAELLEAYGRSKEARKEIDLALRLNPNSFTTTVISARLYMIDGLFEKAIIEANKAKELNKFKGSPVVYIMSCYTYLGKDDEALAEWEEFIKLDPIPNIELNKGLRDAFKNSGIKGFWKYYTQDLLKTSLVDKFPVVIAHNLAYLGEKEKALELLELAYEQRHRKIYRVKNVYDFKNLRNEPRFLAILKKLNLGDYEL